MENTSDETDHSTSLGEQPPEAAALEETSPEVESPRELSRLATLVSMGWLGTNVGIGVSDLPLKFLLKEQLHLTPQGISAFFIIGNFTNYIKPLAGVLTDSVPLFRTRRRYYLLLSLFFTGTLYLLLNLVPRNYGSLLKTYALLYLMVVFTSTTLGGVMVEIGQKFGAAGRLTAQRIGMFRVATLIASPIGGFLASRPFGWAMGLSAAFHFALVALFFYRLPEPPTARLNQKVWVEFRRQFYVLLQSRTLLYAAAMVFLLAASPGFGTPLFFHQTDRLHFSKQFIGNLGLVSSAFGIMGALYYYPACRRLPLKSLLVMSICAHALGTLAYLWYHTQASAIAITALNGITITLATLPIYDLAARATPKGIEAIGYSVMMSVWNLTNALSDWTGSWLYDHFHLTFINLVWLNAGTTALALIAVPLVPAVLLAQRDGKSH